VQWFEDGLSPSTMFFMSVLEHLLQILAPSLGTPRSDMEINFEKPTCCHYLLIDETLHALAMHCLFDYREMVDGLTLVG